MTSGTLEEFVMLERDHTIAMQKKRRPMIAASSAANVMVSGRGGGGGLERGTQI